MHGWLVSNDARACDAENVLFYNLQSAPSLGRAGAAGIRFERVFTEPPTAPDGLSGLAYYHRYQTTEQRDPFTRWRPARSLAHWRNLPLPLELARYHAAQSWFRMHGGAVEIVGSATGYNAKFGLRLALHTTAATAASAASLIKPIFDGVIASFQRHDGTDLDEVSARIADRLSEGAGVIRRLLMQDSHAILGAARLVRPWQQSVQWNPCDDRCVAGELLVVRDQPPGAPVLMSGELLEVEPS
jgi:hypothetical protein